ncbi:MAG: hypothetical protein WDN46_03975 [Methylocella sp.]
MQRAIKSYSDDLLEPKMAAISVAYNDLLRGSVNMPPQLRPRWAVQSRTGAIAAVLPKN